MLVSNLTSQKVVLLLYKQMWGYYCGMFEETAANGVRENGIISDGVVYKTGEKYS